MNYLLSDIARIVGGELRGDDLRIREIATDSRSVTQSSDTLFAAINGKHHDGHNFVERMALRGVRSFIVEREMELAKECSMIIVENTIVALQRLAEYHRSLFRGTIVGITGSNGKTIVKEWAARSMPSTVRSFASPKSYNSQLGVALSLLMLEGEEQVAFIEAGISEPGEMERLERMIRPDIVVITSIGDAHSANFASEEQKIEEKLKLCLNAKSIIYSKEYRSLERHIIARYSDRELIDSSSESVDEILELSDALSVDAAHVAALMHKLGYGVDGAVFSAKVAMRLELKEGIDNSMIIDDTYNSDINSVIVALDALHRQSMGRRKIAVISDILQSGMAEEELYRRVAEAVKNAHIDHLIGVGAKIAKHSKLFDLNSSFYYSTDELLENFSRERWADSVILVKGSRDSRFERIIRLLERRTHTTTLEVDLAAMKKNLNYFRRHLPHQHPIVAMVKAWSYGTGDVDVARMLQHEGVAYLAVAFADEGVTLRLKGITMPIVVLNADHDSFDVMISHDLEPEIYSFQSLDEFRRAVHRAGRENYPIHVKLDTGMHRLGFVEDDIDLLGRAIHLDTTLRIASIFSHLSCADIPAEDDFTRKQLESFEYMSSQLIEWLDYTPLRHIANSAAIVRFKEARYDMCRLGLGLYGYGFEHNEELIPVATLSTRIVQIKQLRKGESVGYGRTERLERDTTIATIPVGYADGLDRHLGNRRWSVSVKGKRAAILGRVCMDSAMIDISDIEGVAVGDKVTIFGGERGLTLEDMARVLDTISYEIMTSISARVKRIYTER
ncbi:MAG: alanine racemase [Alistipes sp.]|nr:alanine racemase [Alistipes sp.]